MIKICKVCKKEFLLNNGNQKYCSQECYQKAVKKYMKEYHSRPENKVKAKKSMKEYCQINKQKLSILKKIYYLKNKNKISTSEKQYYIEHKGELNLYSKKYYKKHKEKIIEQKRKYEGNKLQIDINFRIKHYLRSRLRKALKGINKSKSTRKLIGCSIEQLKNHLESQFKPGMSFSNYGKWHIDHIKPCFSFDLSKAEEQAKCFHYTNLQPLWAEENLRKNKY